MKNFNYKKLVTEYNNNPNICLNCKKPIYCEEDVFLSKVKVKKCPNCDSQLDTYKSKNKNSARKFRKNIITLKTVCTVMNRIGVGTYVWR